MCLQYRQKVLKEKLQANIRKAFNFLTLFYSFSYYFPFSYKKVGIVGHFQTKVGKSRSTRKKVGKSRNNRKSRARWEACKYIALGWGQTNPWGPNLFQSYLPSVHLPISCKICLSNDILTIFPIQMHGRPMLTLL